MSDISILDYRYPAINMVPEYDIRNLSTGLLIATRLHRHQVVLFIKRNRELKLGLERV